MAKQDEESRESQDPLLAEEFAELKGDINPPPPDHTFCGRTPADAVKNGCHFEPMLSSWVPEACYFTDEGDYDVFEDLPWYSDPFLRQPLNTTEMMNVRAGNYGHVYTTWRTTMNIVYTRGESWRWRWRRDCRWWIRRRQMRNIRNIVRGLRGTM
ncbi:hypothetical protein H4I96_00855 [Botrytis cinerea]